MKREYKYTINGNEYEVAIGEIVENEATVTVNGEEYKVVMQMSTPIMPLRLLCPVSLPLLRWPSATR